MNGLTPIGFAISIKDINQLEKDIRKLKFKTNGVEDWSRKKPSGETIQ